MTTPDIDMQALGDDELDQLWQQLATEKERRLTLATAEARAADLARQWADAAGRKNGDEWRQPEGAHDAYETDALAERNGQMYRNDHPGLNPWEPGTLNSGWTPIWPDEESGGWTDTPPSHTGQPTPWQAGIHYSPGDLVTHDGKTWSCLVDHIAHDGWAPSPETHAVWTPVDA